MHKSHLRSVWHRNYRRIQAYLASDCMTLQEMADRLGITRERVRQLLLQTGQYDSLARRAVCRLNKQARRLAQQVEQLPATRLGRFIAACAERGIECTLLETSRGYDTRKVFVGNKLVFVKAVQRCRKPNFVRIVGTFEEVDLIAYEMLDGRWYFRAPWKSANGHRGHSTMFSLTAVKPGGLGYTHNKQHDLYKGIEAWSQLTA